MSTLTANIVFATYQALPESEKDAFLELVGKKENKKPIKPNKKRKSTLPLKFQKGNAHILAAEIMNE